MSTCRLILCLLVLCLFTGCVEVPEAPVTDRLNEAGTAVRMDQVVRVSSHIPGTPDGARRYCVGVRVGPSTVLTAGHCVVGHDQFLIHMTNGLVVEGVSAEATCTTCIDPEIAVTPDVGLIRLGSHVSAPAFATVTPGSDYSEARIVNIRNLGAKNDTFFAHDVELWPGDVLATHARYFPACWVTDRVGSHGDSGAPVFRAGTLELVGLLSAETPDSNVITRLDKAADWIKERVQ